MSFQAQLTRTFTADGSDNLSQSQVITTPSKFGQSSVVPAGATTILTVTIVKALVALLYISTDVEIDVIFNTSPTDRITVSPDVPLIWSTDCGLENPITGNFSSMDLDNSANASAANVEVRIYYDA